MSENLFKFPYVVRCPGCSVEITENNAGGYRTYCEKCVSVMPPIPIEPAGIGWQLRGKYPDFTWLPHCLICGDAHNGECPPSNFVYFQCSACQGTTQMPWDAAAFGLQGVHCCSNDVDASESWQRITYERFTAIKGNDKH
jgi:hypothetical protein